MYFHRLERIIASPRYRKADTYLVGIGTNDILLPHLSTISTMWNRQMIPRCRRKKCITDDKTFRRAYERYLSLLSMHPKKIILLGLPYIQLENYPQDKIRRRNRIIRELAVKYGASFVDTRAIQLKQLENPKYYSWKHKNISRLFDSAVMLFFHLQRITLDGKESCISQWMEFTSHRNAQKQLPSI